jgi:ParB/RepB/Spo0J family partition protein
MTLSAIKPELVEVPVGLIDEPRLMSRNEVDDAHVDDLVQSIRQQGFTSSIVLARVGDRYEVIAGHHRTLAARRVPLATVPALVYPSYLDGIQAIQHSENALQKPTSPCDQAIWYAELVELYPDEGTDGVARRVGEKRDFVEARLALLNGDPEVFRALGNDEIKIGVAQQLNRCTELAHRRMLLDQAIRGGATVGLVTQWVSEWRTIHLPASSGAPLPAPDASGPTPIMQEYFRCRHCGEKHNTANMLPVQIHDYCLQQLTDPATGMFRSRADYVMFPRTREDAVALVKRLIERFPELADESAA